MKWPASIVLIRHGESAYNELKIKKDTDPEYVEFKTALRSDPYAAHTRAMAEELFARYPTPYSDSQMPLTEMGGQQARLTGEALSRQIDAPDVIFVSPYLRTQQTLSSMTQAWGKLERAKIVVEDRIREKEHGLATLYGDWRFFYAFHPEQRRLNRLMGEYWYQYPQGESVSHVRDRIRSVTATLIREYAGQHVMFVTHHLTILSIRANFERLSPEEFQRLDREEKPINCGVTLYRCDPSAGISGRLKLDYYNRRLYDV
jgi:broad specificity phosphatase PhoE